MSYSATGAPLQGSRGVSSKIRSEFALIQSGLDALIAGSVSLGTPIAATSGTSIDITGISAGANRITITFKGVSTSADSNNLLIQLGDAGGFESTGYESKGAFLGGSYVSGGAASFTGFQLTFPTQSLFSVYYGSVTLTKVNNSFMWVSNGLIYETLTTDGLYISSGWKNTSAALDRVRVTTVAGTATFDLGEINILIG